MNHTGLTLVPLSFAVVIAACGGIENDPSTPHGENTESIQVRNDVRADDGLDLIATLSLHNGNVLRFYEASPGAMLISETGRVPNPPVSTKYDLQSMSLVEIHQTFAPGKAVPAALTAAQHRLDARIALGDVTAPESDVEPFGNHDDVAMNHDANQDNGTKNDDTSGNPKRASGFRCTEGWFRNEICAKSSRLPYARKHCNIGLSVDATTNYRGMRQGTAAVCVDKPGKFGVTWTFTVGNSQETRSFKQKGDWEMFTLNPFSGAPVDVRSHVTGSDFYRRFRYHMFTGAF